MYSGWNCFDIAIGLADLLEIEQTDPEERARAARIELVQRVLAQASNPEFRHLLAPEIRHATGITAIYMNMRSNREQKHVEQNKRLIELFEIAEGLSGKPEKNQILYEINKLFELEGEKQTNQELEYHILPSSMRTKELRNLVNSYFNSHEIKEMRDAITSCNNAIGRKEDQGLSVDSHDQFFREVKNPRLYPVAYSQFQKAFESILKPYEDVLNEHCLKESTYRQYVQDYYGNKGWFSFQRQFTGESSTSMVDIVAKLLNIKLAIYQPDGNIYIANPSGRREIFINCDGVKHFSMWDQLQSFDNSRREVSIGDVVREIGPNPQARTYQGSAFKLELVTLFLKRGIDKCKVNREYSFY
jgi:hypothetical protein